jgi:hypothetical protein
MATIITRAGKGSPLTNAEVDANFTNLNSDKLETAGGTLTGPTVVNVNSSSTALRVTQVGTGAALLVEDEANPDASPLIVNASGNVGIGTTTPGVRLDVAGAAAITDNSSSDALRITQTGAGNALLVEDATSPDATPFVVTGAGNVGVGTATPAVKLAISSTDAVLIPVGTTGERPVGATGYLRYNSTTNSFEGHNGTAWGSIGGGATGGSGDQAFYLNSTTINNSYSIPSGQNAGTFGPVTVASGAVVTVPSGSTWTVV